MSAEVQGLPVRYMGLWFSILTALVVVSMVKITGTLLATALLVTPAATPNKYLEVSNKPYLEPSIWINYIIPRAIFLCRKEHRQRVNDCFSVGNYFRSCSHNSPDLQKLFSGPNSAK